MINSTMISVAANNDAELVNGTLSGDRDAFAKIITRYQGLICSLTYSATGNLGHSEDLAQETFISAWKHLAQLRERDKLRSWLCGIARNRINNFLRREGREPIHQAESLEDAPESHSPEPLPVEYTISKEEETILWRSLEKIPVLYREPLVLFYREHQSVKAVAEKLELTEDTVQQRLSRGRKMLQEQVLTFVEGALGRTNPGQAFTLSVLGALPALTFSAKAATLGTVAAKGASSVKAAGVMGLFSAICSPLLILFGNYSNYRMSLDEAQTDEERDHVKTVFRKALLVALGISAIVAVPLHWACCNEPQWWVFWTLLLSQGLVVYFLSLLAMVLTTLPGRRRYLMGVLAQEHGGDYPPAAFEYKSRATLLGLPLVHIRIGDRFDVVRGPVKAWIAIGSSHAVGVIFASGGIAVAPISFGGIAIGILSLGAIAIGVLPFGAVSLGVWAYGGLAIGWEVFCGAGMGWNAATGGIVASHGFADGGISFGTQTNNLMVKEFVQQNLFFRVARAINNHGVLLMLLWVIPVTLQARIVGLARRRRELAKA
jgi:RNA polymerase sigma factor (sigma-70 family)